MTRADARLRSPTTFPMLFVRLFTACVGLSLGSAGLRAQGDVPHILFVIADDWGPQSGAYGTPWVKTPAFDRIAREGLLFRQAYTPVAKCAPSRAILLTGRHAWQNGAAANHLAYFPPDLRTWPEVLLQQGWHVGVTGKGWAPGVARTESGEPRLLTGRVFGKRTTAPPSPEFNRNDYAANFSDFLDAAPAGKPWSFWVGTSEPHRAYEHRSGLTKGGRTPEQIDRVPAYWPDDVRVREDLLDYAYAVDYFDQQLGRIVAELEKRGLLDSTLIIVTGDHGMPFPRVKGFAYRASNHVPLAIRWPKGIRGSGRTIDDFVDFTDLAPTLLDYARVDAAKSGMKPMTGRSLRPIFETEKSGRVVAERDHVLIGRERTDVGRPNDEGYPIRGIITADYLYLRNYEPGRWPAGNPETGYLDTDGSPTKTLILQRGRENRADVYWQLGFGRRAAEEFFDLRLDADCVINLAAQPARVGEMALLRDRMETLLRAQEDPRQLGRGAEFDRYPATQGAGFYEKHRRGEAVQAGWVTPSDFEPAPLD